MSNELFASLLDDVVTQPILPLDMLQDFRSIAGLRHESAVIVGKALKALPVPSNIAQIDATIRKCLEASGEEHASESVLRALINLDYDSISQLASVLWQWASGDEKRREIFAENVVDQLRRNLEALTADNPTLRIVQKAERLLRDVGNELQSIKFVCDLRPVFDDDRKNIEAFVAVANMRLLYVSQDGERRACEMALTEDELTHFKEHVDRALDKMHVLNETRATLTLDRVQTEGEG